MAELWTLMSFFCEKCEENSTTHHLCKEIAEQYIAVQKRQLRIQVAREQNLRLKLEFENLKIVFDQLSENNKAQEVFNTLLQEYYKEHLQICFDMGECEMEKLYSFDSLKAELENRDTIQIYQHFYTSKIKMAKKMESRSIVSKYRVKEGELLTIRDELVALENNIKELKNKIKRDTEVQHELIYQLVKGSKDLQTFYSQKKSYSNESLHSNCKPAENENLPIKITKVLNKIPNKKGLSARMSLDVKKCEIPSAPALTKIRRFDLTKSRNRLLQQAENIRKSMKSTVSAVSDEHKLSSILKIPAQLSTPTEGLRKTVSFEKNLIQTTSESSPDIPYTPQNYLDTKSTELTPIIVEENKVDLKSPTIEILEDVILKPASPPSEQLSIAPVSPICEPRKITKRKPQATEPSSSPKKKRVEIDADKFNSSSFMDMFLRLSKDTSTASTSIELPTTQKVSGDIEIQMAPPVDEKKENTLTTKNKRESFDDFEDFMSGFVANDVVTDSNKEQSEADMSFDFDGGDAGSDNFSFNF